MTEQTRTLLYLVRHGQTESNLAGRIQGQSDSALTELGQMQAGRLAERLQREKITSIYSSDLGRAHHTAKIIAENLKQSVTQTDQLREVCFGQAEKMSWKEVHGLFPEDARRWYQHQEEAKLPEGETREIVVARAFSFLDMVAKEHPNQSTLAVTHGGVLACIFSRILSIPKGVRPQCEITNTAVNVLVYEKKRWKIRTWGEISHLENI